MCEVRKGEGDTAVPSVPLWPHSEHVLISRVFTQKGCWPKGKSEDGQGRDRQPRRCRAWKTGYRGRRKGPLSGGRPSHRQRVPERIIFKAQNKQKGGREEHTHLHTHRHTCTHLHMYTQIYIHIHRETHVHTHVHTDTHTYTERHVNTQTYTHKHTHTHRYTRIHTDTYTYLHRDTHTYTHVHTHEFWSWRRAFLPSARATLNAGSSLPIMDVIPSGM